MIPISGFWMNQIMGIKATVFQGGKQQRDLLYAHGCGSTPDRKESIVLKPTVAWRWSTNDGTTRIGDDQVSKQICGNNEFMEILMNHNESMKGMFIRDLVAPYWVLQDQYSTKIGWWGISRHWRSSGIDSHVSADHKAERPQESRTQDQPQHHCFDIGYVHSELAKVVYMIGFPFEMVQVSIWVHNESPSGNFTLARKSTAFWTIHPLLCYCMVHLSEAN